MFILWIYILISPKKLVMNFSHKAVLSYDVRTKSLKVIDGVDSPVYFPIVPRGVSIEFSNNRLNVNGFGLSNPPVSTHVFNIVDPFIPYIDWDSVKKDIIIGTKVSNRVVGETVTTGHIVGEVVSIGHKTRNAQLFIGVDPARGNYGVKISISGQELWVEQGLVTAAMLG